MRGSEKRRSADGTSRARRTMSNDVSRRRGMREAPMKPVPPLRTTGGLEVGRVEQVGRKFWRTVGGKEGR